MFIAANALTFVITLVSWLDIVSNMKKGLRDGTLEVQCASLMCHVNRKVVKYG